MNRSLFFVLIFAVSFGASAASEQLSIKTDSKRSVMFRVEVADTPEEMRRGLMFRKELLEGRGMIFLLEKERIANFWMRNTYVPLDLIFIDNQHKVAHIVENTTPLSDAAISSRVPVVAVLEIPAGSVKKYSIKVGNDVVYP